MLQIELLEGNEPVACESIEPVTGDVEISEKWDDVTRESCELVELEVGDPEEAVDDAVIDHLDAAVAQVEFLQATEIVPTEVAQVVAR